MNNLTFGAVRKRLLLAFSLPGLLFASGLQAAGASGEVLAAEDFENGIVGWVLENPEHVQVVSEPGTGNHVLQLTPKSRDFVSAILSHDTELDFYRLEGRFLFPTEGDGYLGFIYHHQAGESRTDFGCIYVKSNGSYVRVSPHYDGNPSWRLYEDFRIDLDGGRKIEVGAWYRFRLDVRGASASLYIGDMDRAIVSFDQAPTRKGAVGFEARPGRGEPVWVDDVVINVLPGLAETPGAPPRQELAWEVYGPLAAPEGDPASLPSFEELSWRPIQADSRGALITGAETQFRSGDLNVVYLRTRVDVAEGESGPNWLAVSTANRLDVWYRGIYRGSAAGEQFIWQDYLTSVDHPGARLPLTSVTGSNELIIRVHGRRFAGGGLYASLVER